MKALSSCLFEVVIISIFLMLTPTFAGQSVRIINPSDINDYWNDDGSKHYQSSDIKKFFPAQLDSCKIF